MYDVFGNELEVPVNEKILAASYEVDFSAIGRSASGGDAWNLTSGIYFYRLQAAEFFETKLMVIMK